MINFFKIFKEVKDIFKTKTFYQTIDKLSIYLNKICNFFYIDLYDYTSGLS